MNGECFIDGDHTDRGLTGRIWPDEEGSYGNWDQREEWNVDSCKAKCSEIENLKTGEAFQYMGLMNGWNCYCGVAAPDPAREVDSGKCNQPCANGIHMCGARWRMNIYTLDIPNPAIDCSSNNGGCSHTCSNSECSCPPCWTLKSDGLGCQPEADKVTLSCASTSMGLKVDKCVLDGYAAGDAYAGSDGNVAACKMQAVDNGDFYQVSSNLNDCGTAVDFSDASKLDYTNKLTIPAEVLEGGIILNAPLEWEYTCSYKTEYELEANMEMKSEIIQGSFKVEDAEFNFDFGFYSSTDLTTKLTNPVFRVGNQINFAGKITWSILD